MIHLRRSAGTLRGRRRALLLGLLVVVASIAPLARGASADVTTIHFNTTRQGVRSDLPNLKPPGFERFDTPVSGQVYGQPLVVGNTVIVATENDMVYGINKTTGAISWQHSVGTAEPSTVIGCQDVNPSYGVTSTPVVDPASGIVYLTARTWDGSNPNSATWRAFAFSATNGSLQPGWPITIGGKASNDSGSTFDPTVQNQRTGLLLLQGRVFFGFASMCDLGDFKGWIGGISTSTRALSLWTAETGGNVEGGVWQSGDGLASDGTSIFASTGNGSIPTPGPGTTPQGALGMSTLRLTVDSNGNLHQADRFTPFNSASLSSKDFDMGSGGPVLLPSGFGNVPNHPNLLVQPSKTSLYLLDANNLGGMAGAQGPDNIVSQLPNQSDWGYAAVWPGDGGYFYLNDVTPNPSETAGPVTAYQVTPTGQLRVAGTSKEQFGWPSGPPVITSNGTTAGSATLWVIDRNGFLRAYNPVPVNGTLQLLWSGSLDGAPTKFSVPATDGSDIFVGTSGHVLAFSAPQPPTPTAVVSSPQFGVPNQTDVFSVGADGTINVRWVNGAGAWNGPIPIGPPGLAPPGAHLAVSKQFGIANQTDLFVIGKNGAVQVLWVDGVGAWNGPLAISRAGLAPPGAQLAASNQFGLANQTDVFVVDTTGAFNVLWVQGFGAWREVAITQAGLAPPGAGLAASNQFGIPNRTDVFLVSANGAENVLSIDSPGSWNGPLAISPTGLAPPGAQLAASNQFGIPNQTDVFVVDSTGAFNVAWINSPGAWNGPLALSQAGLAPPGAGLAASNQFGIPNQTDVFLVDGSGTARVMWIDSPGAWGGPLAISPGVAPAGAAPAASNQFGLPTQTDVFFLDSTGAAKVLWVQGAGAWNGPLRF